MTAFDKWAELDPAKLQRDIETSGCSDVTLTRYVDVEDMVRRINAKHPGTVDVWGNLDPHRLGRQLSVGCSGGGGGGYVAKAVTFIGDPTFSGNGAQIQVVPATSSSLLSLSLWINYTVDELAAGGNIIGKSDGFSLLPLWNFTTDIGGKMTDSNFTDRFSFGTPDGVLAAETWTHIFFSCDVGQPTGQKILDLYVNAVSKLDPANLIDPFPDGFVPAISAEEGGAIILPDVAGGPHDQSYADVQMWIGQRIAPTVGNLAKFISAGKPIDPVVAAEAFGTPSILFSGDATGFIVNQGTAGTSSVIAGSITNASTSPSD